MRWAAAGAAGAGATSAMGVSTITCVTPCSRASGWQRMRAKLVSLCRSTLTTRATGRPGGYTPSMPLVASRSPSLKSTVAGM